MAKERAAVSIIIELVGETGNKRETTPAQGHISGCARVVGTNADERHRGAFFDIADTDTFATIKANGLAALDALIGVP